MRDTESWGTLHRPAFETLEPRLLLNGTINDPAQLGTSVADLAASQRRVMRANLFSPLLARPITPLPP